MEQLAHGSLPRNEIRQITFGEPRTEDPGLTLLWESVQGDLRESKLSGERMHTFAANAGRWSEKTVEDLTNAAMDYTKDQEDQTIETYLRAIQAVTNDGIAAITERSEHLPSTPRGSGQPRR